MSEGRPFKLAKRPSERSHASWGTVEQELRGVTERQVDGARWTHRVLEAGEGEPLLLYHGIGGHAEAFARNMATLSAEFHVYAVDALFHGGSSKTDFEFARMYELLAEGFIDLVDALGHDSVHFAGDSLGAQFGVVVGLKWPQRLKRMVLTNGFYLQRDGMPIEAKTEVVKDLGKLSSLAITEPNELTVGARLRWLMADPDRMTDDMIRIRTRLYTDPAVNESLRRIFNIGDPRGFSLHLYDWPYGEGELAEWEPETLVVFGEHNPGTDLNFAKYCASLIDSWYYIVKDAGHWPQWEKPDEYNHLLIEFLKAPLDAPGKAETGVESP